MAERNSQIPKQYIVLTDEMRRQPDYAQLTQAIEATHPRRGINSSGTFYLTAFNPKNRNELIGYIEYTRDLASHTLNTYQSYTSPRFRRHSIAQTLTYRLIAIARRQKIRSITRMVQDDSMLKLGEKMRDNPRTVRIRGVKTDARPESIHVRRDRTGMSIAPENTTILVNELPNRRKVRPGKALTQASRRRVPRTPRHR